MIVDYRYTIIGSGNLAEENPCMLRGFYRWKNFERKQYTDQWRNFGSVPLAFEDRVPLPFNPPPPLPPEILNEEKSPHHLRVGLRRPIRLQEMF